MFLFSGKPQLFTDMANNNFDPLTESVQRIMDQSILSSSPLAERIATDSECSPLSSFYSGRFTDNESSPLSFNSGRLTEQRFSTQAAGTPSTTVSSSATRVANGRYRPKGKSSCVGKKSRR